MTFLLIRWISLWPVIVAFPDHAHILFNLVYLFIFVDAAVVEDLSYESTDY